MKKILTFVIAFVCVFALIGCKKTTQAAQTKANSSANVTKEQVSQRTYNESALAWANKVKETMGGKQYLKIKQAEWDRLQSYYEISQLSSASSETKELNYANGTTLRIAAGYNSKKTGIAFDSDTAGDGVKVGNTTYHSGDLKPTWAFLQTKLGVTFENKYQGNSASNEFKYWESQLADVDIIAGTATQLNDAGVNGEVINLAQYLDYMPNFKAYLEANPIVKLSITGDTSSGAIYFSPYFDGVDDIERMPLMRYDLVMELLDGDTEYKGDNRAVNTSAYTPYMPTTGTVSVESLNADGTATQTITKDYSKYGNIIEKMNATQNLTGDQAVKMLREYIDATYAGVYDKRSDLFLGYDACWDADEMVALLRCAVASLSYTIVDEGGKTTTAPINGLYSRETQNLQREVDLFRFAGTLFGVRGLESRNDYLYFDSEGTLHDARQEADTYEAVARMNALVKEGLLVVEGTDTSDKYLYKDSGLMSYDYNQTQTLYNATKLNAKGQENTDTDEKYSCVMVPVAKWYDGTNVKDDVDQGVYMRFTESWRSVKTDAWAISAAGVAGNNDKLYAALALIDYAFSVQGQILMSYGPDEFIKVKSTWKGGDVTSWDEVSEKYETFSFNGQDMPIVADVTTELLWSLASGNYTNFARYYLGSTLNGFPKSQAFEYQCTQEVGKEGAALLSAAIGLGTIKHPVLKINTENMWYTSTPTTLPTTSQETSIISKYTDLSSSGYFSSSKGGYNLLFDIIKNGYNTTKPAAESK